MRKRTIILLASLFVAAGGAGLLATPRPASGSMFYDTWTCDPALPIGGGCERGSGGCNLGHLIAPNVCDINSNETSNCCATGGEQQ